MNQCVMCGAHYEGTGHTCTREAHKAYPYPVYFSESLLPVLERIARAFEAVVVELKDIKGKIV